MIRLFFLLTLSLPLSGCLTTGPVFEHLVISDLQVARLPEAAAVESACWGSDSRLLLLAGAALSLYDSESGARLWQRAPADLISCSTHGLRLVAAATTLESSTLLDCPGSTGVCREGTVPGQLLLVSWDRSGDPLLLTLRHRSFSFGENLSYQLYRWRHTVPELLQTLHDVTIRKGRFAQLEESLVDPRHYQRAFHGELLLLPLLHDPPAAGAYLDLHAFAVPGGQNWSIGSLPVDGVLLGSARDEESVLVKDPGGVIRRLDIWGGGELQGPPVSAGALVQSPGGRVAVSHNLWVDGTAEPVSLPVRTEVRFAPDGSQAVLLWNGQVAVARLVPPDPAVAVPSRRVPLETLRAWRASGLIDAAEYGKLLKGE